MKLYITIRYYTSWYYKKKGTQYTIRKNVGVELKIRCLILHRRNSMHNMYQCWQLVTISTFMITVQQISSKGLIFNCADNPHLGSIYCAQNSSIYACLCDDTSTDTSDNCTEKRPIKEFCINKTDNIQYAPIGQKYVWSGAPRNIHCSTGRFQPFGFPIYLGDRCLYQKSLCAGVGEIIYNNESSSNDRTCGCDHRQGYSFVTFPKKRDFCVPFEEDCSCIVKPLTGNEMSDNSSTFGETVLKISSTNNRSPSTQYSNESTTIFSNDGKVKSYAEIPAITTCVFVFLLLTGMTILLLDKFPSTFYDIYFDTQEHKYSQESAIGLDKNINKANEQNVQVDRSSKMNEDGKTQSKSTKGVADRSVTLRCSISKWANDVSIEWFFKGKIIDVSADEGNSKYTGSTVDYPSLNIINLTPDDTGNYECRMTDYTGKEIIRTIDLYVQVQKPCFAIPETVYTERAGSTVTLQCTILSKYSKLVLVEWFHINKSGKQRKITERVGATLNDDKYDSLIMKSVGLDDEGDYICKATNEIGTATSDKITLNIKRGPYISSLLNHQFGDHGSSISVCFDVQVTIGIRYKLEWFLRRGRHETQLQPDGSLQKYTESKITNCSLNISNLTRDDAGIYRCQVTAEDITKSSQSTVAVRCLAPIILPTLPEYTLESDKKAIIVFVIISDPEPTVSFKNGSKLVIATKIEWNMQYACMYVIETDEPGKYKCYATNAVGNSKKEVSVKVNCGFGETIRMIASLDIGSTFSKCAYAMTETLKSGHGEVYNSHAVRFGDIILEPTCILFKKPNEYLAFGKEARSKYEGCIDRKDTGDKIYLQKFTHAWNRLEKSLDDVRIAEKSSEDHLSASDIYAAVIKALMKCVITKIQDRNINIPEDKILWVFTIPPKWYEAAKDFRLETRKQIGIDESRLFVVSESLAATKYATNVLSTEIRSPLPTELTKYLVVDIGGCTCQLTAVQRVGEDAPEELCTSLAESCGGEQLDEIILNLLNETLDKCGMDVLKREETASIMYIKKQLKELKHSYSRKCIDEFTLHVDVFCRRVKGKSFSEVLNESRANENISLKENGNFCINRKFIDAVFQKVSDDIVTAIHEFLLPLKSHNITKFLLVGGFCNSAFIRDEFKKAFPKTDIIYTDDSEFWVAKGAVLLGLEPSIITTRVAQFTYGRRIYPKFNEYIHDPKKKVQYENGDDRCKDVFEAFLQRGEIIPVGKKIKLECEYNTLDNNIAIYMSRKKRPMYTDEQSCTKLCEFQFSVSKGYFDIELEFGKTKLHLKAVDRTTNNEAVQSFQLI